MSRTVVETVFQGHRATFEMERGATTVLEAAQAAQVDLPSMCTAGICATCRARLLAGEVTMLNNMALDDVEVAEGFVLACQSLPLSERLLLDFDCA